MKQELNWADALKDIKARLENLPDHIEEAYRVKPDEKLTCESVLISSIDDGDIDGVEEYFLNFFNTFTKVGVALINAGPCVHITAWVVLDTDGLKRIDR